MKWPILTEKQILRALGASKRIDVEGEVWRMLDKEGLKSAELKAAAISMNLAQMVREELLEEGAAPEELEALARRCAEARGKGRTKALKRLARRVAVMLYLEKALGSE